ncbi:hypothetical protein HELRODRAFT_190007 [Helobdella robusta]|uniref:Uncharacterized protein n=1 Tax=Helobdella robusta TaxID=6412 RepID=T1FRL1_HELRO|nr:hypothetical protein HELRODRAFT_190007 [Helobdella robusta]ESO11575.1 hypothetical protein HELRODRAFT_190007 [Helobdella robusta]
MNKRIRNDVNIEMKKFTTGLMMHGSKTWLARLLSSARHDGCNVKIDDKNPQQQQQQQKQQQQQQQQQKQQQQPCVTWQVSANPGQRISVELFDFSLISALLPSNQSKSALSSIARQNAIRHFAAKQQQQQQLSKDNNGIVQQQQPQQQPQKQTLHNQISQKPTHTLCGAQLNELNLEMSSLLKNKSSNIRLLNTYVQAYETRSNRMKLQLLDRMWPEAVYVIKLAATGCPYIREGTYDDVRVIHNDVTLLKIDCLKSGRTLTMICDGVSWNGTFEDCDNVDLAESTLKNSSSDFPIGSATIFGLILIWCVALSILFLGLYHMKRKRQRKDSGNMGIDMKDLKPLNTQEAMYDVTNQDIYARNQAFDNISTNKQQQQNGAMKSPALIGQNDTATNKIYRPQNGNTISSSSSNHTTANNSDCSRFFSPQKTLLPIATPVPHPNSRTLPANLQSAVAILLPNKKTGSILAGKTRPAAAMEFCTRVWQSPEVKRRPDVFGIGLPEVQAPVMTFHPSFTGKNGGDNRMLIRQKYQQQQQHSLYKNDGKVEHNDPEFQHLKMLAPCNSNSLQRQQQLNSASVAYNYNNDNYEIPHSPQMYQQRPHQHQHHQFTFSSTASNQQRQQQYPPAHQPQMLGLRAVWINNITNNNVSICDNNADNTNNTNTNRNDINNCYQNSMLHQMYSIPDKCKRQQQQPQQTTTTAVMLCSNSDNDNNVIMLSSSFTNPNGGNTNNNIIFNNNSNTNNIIFNAGINSSAGNNNNNNIIFNNTTHDYANSDPSDGYITQNQVPQFGDYIGPSEVPDPSAPLLALAFRNATYNTWNNDSNANRVIDRSSGDDPCDVVDGVCDGGGGDGGECDGDVGGGGGSGGVKDGAGSYDAPEEH